MSPPSAKSSVSQETSPKRRGLLIRWWGLWILLGLGSIVALSWLLPQALGTFGLGALVLPIWLWLVLKVVAGNRWRWVARHPQLWLAAIVFQAALQGLLAFYFEPRWLVIGKASIQQVSSGGLIGLAILGTPDWLGGVRVGSLAFMGIFILSPRGVWRSFTALGRLKPAILFLGRFLKAAVAVLFSILSWFFRALWGFSTALTRFLVRVVPIIRRRGRAQSEPPGHPAVRPHPRSAEARESPQMPARREPVSPAREPAEVRTSVSPPPPRHQTRAEPAPATSARASKGDGSPWPLPPLEILERTPVHEFNEADVKERAKLIVEALASYGVDAKVEQINPGPVVTQFGVEPGWERKYKQVQERDGNGRPLLDKKGKPRISRVPIEGAETRVKVERITALSNNLAMALAVPSVRIEAPVPGQALVGIEVPNRSFNTVGLRGVIESTTFQKLRARTNLSLALGRGAGGEVVVADLAKMPHLLIAGATGSGKTVCLNSAIACLLMHNTPENARMMMIDPKRVELTPYNYIPHLLSPVIVDTDTAIEALKRLNREMDTRYKKLASLAVRNIEVYNRDYAHKNGPMPYILVFVDELADLMMAAPDVVEPLICRLAQLARATGIHLVVATQRPSVDVVTGLIKANFPTRISFAVTSQVDSRTILDGVGAEKLLGRGDMLYLPTDAAKPKRLQGVYVSDPEIDRIVAHWRRWGDANYQDTVATAFASLPAQGASDDPLLQRARQLAKEHTRLSASFLQRRLQIGYSRAQEILEILDAEAAVNSRESPGPDDDAPSSPATELDQGRK